jgi:hypothetical protein
MTLGELRRSLERWADLSDATPVTLVVNHRGEDGAGYTAGPLTTVMTTPAYALVLMGDAE